MKSSLIRYSLFIAAMSGTLLMPVAGLAQSRNRDSARNVKLRQDPQPAQLYLPRPWEPVEEVPNIEAPTTPAVTLTYGAWAPIGPGPLNSGGSSGMVSGRIAGIAAHPTDPQTIYIAAAGGGVWKTTNGGTTWVPLTDTQATTTMGCIAIAPSNPQVVYAGTGEANNSLDSNFGRGILVSVDGGANWTRRTGPGNIFNNSRLTCSKIVVDPTNANIAYAAIANQGNNGIFSAGTTGIYKTTDGGITWLNVTSANGKSNTYPWSDVAIDQNNPAIIYASIGYIFGNAVNGIYKSVDSGATWTLLNAANAPVGASFGRISLAISKLNAANVMYGAAEDNTVSSGLARFVRSDDAGLSFSTLTSPNFMGAQGWYDQSLMVDPTASATAYATGASSTSASMIRTITSGNVWTAYTTGTNGVSPHVDHHAMAFDANGKLLDGNDGGIYRLEDPTTLTWTNLNGNLATIQFQGIGMHPTNPNIAIGGSQDNGTEVYSGSMTWTETDGGDGGWAKFSQTNGQIAYHQIPTGSFGSNFFRVSTNGGASWVTRTSTIVGDQGVQQFYAPFVVDPSNGDRVLYGTNRVWETTNEGTTWTPLGVVNTAGWNPSGGNVNAIGLAPSDVNTIYAAPHASGSFGNTNIYVTTDHGATWNARNLPVGAQVSDIQVDPTVPLTAYATTSSFNATSNVWKTVDGGANWTNISGDLATVTACACAVPVWSLQIDKLNNRIYIGAEDGVYVTANGGTNWTRFGTGLPNGQVFQIELNPTLQVLGAGIHGRGMWKASTAVPSAAGVTVSGRVLASADGRGLTNARVSITGPDGVTQTVVTGRLGRFVFTDVQAGQSYIVSVAARRYSFEPKALSIEDSVSGLDFYPTEGMVR